MFATTYTYEVDPEFPGTGEWDCSTVCFDLSGAVMQESSPNGASVIVRISPHSGDDWVAMFPAGDTSEHTGVYPTPMPDHLAVVTTGDAYLVDTKNPGRPATIICDQATQVVPIFDPALLLFASFSDIVAVGPAGPKWSTPRLCLDGLEVQEVNQNGIICTCSNLGETTTITLDPTTGLQIAGTQFGSYWPSGASSLTRSIDKRVAGEEFFRSSEGSLPPPPFRKVPTRMARDWKPMRPGRKALALLPEGVEPIWTVFAVRGSWPRWFSSYSIICYSLVWTLVGTILKVHDGESPSHYVTTGLILFPIGVVLLAAMQLSRKTFGCRVFISDTRIDVVRVTVWFWPMSLVKTSFEPPELRIGRRRRRTLIIFDDEELMQYQESWRRCPQRVQLP